MAVFVLSMTALLLIVGCSPKANTVDKAPDEPSIQLPDWTINTNCLSCHAVEVDSMSDDSSPASAHASLACVSCHTDADGNLSKAHANYSSAKDPDKLKMTTIPSDTCVGRGCHDYEALTVAGEGSTVYDQTTGQSLNPHDLPNGDVHYQSMKCASCHKMHGLVDGISKTATEVCNNCHHDNIFEPCSDCHGDEN
ncbi:MAG: cytochrome c3 family protein [Coriobacteriia bacterium]|nr:cytochrome c3 family protein [Coriobacteriia bacterium]